MDPAIAKRPVELHAAVLIAASLIGGVGYYRQHHLFQPTACIPASVGLLLLALLNVRVRNEQARAWLLLLVTFGFGVVVTNLALRFIQQEFQPLRKRLYFPAMALSSLATCGVLARAQLRRGAK